MKNIVIKCFVLFFVTLSAVNAQDNKPASDKTKEGVAMRKDSIRPDSVQAMITAAESQGWLHDREIMIVPELLNMYNQASDYFYKLINENDPRYRETFVFHTCKYLFAKGVEGVILWGASPDGKISVFFHPRHLVGEFESEVPTHLHKVVLDSLKVGETLFQAHQGWIIKQQESGKNLDLDREIKETLEWIPRLGMSYALENQYETLHRTLR
jgi:hypothetical protein